MASNIGPRIGIEGEDAFRQELKGINDDLRLLASESKAVAAEFKNQTDATAGLAKQNDLLKQKQEDLNSQLAIQEKAYQAAREQLGETDATTQKWAIALNNTRAALAETEGAIKSNNEELKNLKKEKFEDTIKKIGDGFVAVGKVAAAAGAAIGAAVGGIVKVSNDMAKAGDEVDKMSQKLGMSTDAYQEWGYVLELAGTDITSMTTGMKTLTNQIDDAKNGSTSAQERFAKLGISMEQLNGLSREDAFAAVVSGMQGMADSTERAALANDLFGKSGQNLTPLFNQTAEQTQEQIQLAHEYGMVMSEDMVKASADFLDAQTTLQGALSGLRNKLMGEFLPSMTEVANGLAAVFAGDESGMGQVRQGLEGFFAQVTAQLPMIMELGTQILGGFVEGVVSMFPSIMQSGVDMILQLIQGIVEMLPTLVDAAGQLIVTVAQGIASAIPQLVPTIVEVVLSIVDTLLANLGLLIEAAIQIVIALAKGIIDALPRLIEKIPEIVNTIVKVLTDNLPLLVEAGIMLTIEITKGLIKAIPDLVKALPQIISALVNGLLEGLKNMAEVGLNLVEGLWNGIKNAKDWLLGKLKEWAGSVVKGIKNFFGIHSPSTVFAGIGENLALGLGEGFDDGMTDVRKDIIGAIPTPSLPGLISGAVNGINAANAGGANYAFQLVLPDGRLMAEYVFNPLTEYAKANGTPILNPT